MSKAFIDFAGGTTSTALSKGVVKVARNEVKEIGVGIGFEIYTQEEKQAVLGVQSYVESQAFETIVGSYNEYMIGFITRKINDR